ncbi:MAG: helix-turn-helix domain-containing protein [Planctomycetota bacterium]
MGAPSLGPSNAGRACDHRSRRPRRREASRATVRGRGPAHYVQPTCPSPRFLERSTISSCRCQQTFNGKNPYLSNTSLRPSVHFPGDSKSFFNKRLCRMPWADFLLVFVDSLCHATKLWRPLEQHQPTEREVAMSAQPSLFASVPLKNPAHSRSRARRAEPKPPVARTRAPAPSPSIRLVPDEHAHQPGESSGPLLLTEREAAQMLAVCPRTLWQLRHDGRIPCVYIGRSVRYARTDLETWVRGERRFTTTHDLARQQPVHNAPDSC